MTNEEILKAVIEKVQKNGWYPETIFKIVHYDGSIGTSMFLVGAFDDDGNPESFRRDIETLIYQPYFAKAFWGENKIDIIFCKKCIFEKEYDKHNEVRFCPIDGSKLKEGQRTSWEQAWKDHLQEMVLEEDPIKYLEQFL